MPDCNSDNDFRRQSIRFFNHLALSRVAEMRLLFRGGKLWKRDGWRQVVEHCLVQVALAGIFAELLKMSAAERSQLETAAAIHDWNKRHECRPDDFTELERHLAVKYLKNSLPVNSALIAATSTSFLKKALIDRTASELELTQFFIDELCMGGRVCDWRVRINDLEQRKPHLNTDSMLTESLGGPYWSKERELCARVEQHFHTRLVNLGHKIGVASELPRFIADELRKTIRG